MAEAVMSMAITIPVIFEMGFRVSTGLLSWSAFNFAPTAAVAGMAAQIIHMLTPYF
jgi:hypothetical protein